ncbi:hypothetical protein [Rugosimonospora africana]|uniref:Uncharacterized protein n=1 Tax=Rugosimonospora africana TaxID=556532 RepID=A0A8J3VVG1_9ACTN|nr:hypothetical protein [Rugosimonospora africana]GIH20622.1 hypothetical protein Raf01_87940 [Rugosimonospora africana]
MQIVEVSVAGVRSSIMTLTRRESPLRFQVYPMVHLGEPAFYAAVAERLRRCDLVVAEGVGGVDTGEGRVVSSGYSAGKAALSALTATYRLPARSGRSGLVEQNIDYASLGVPVRYPDMTEEQFTAGWNAVPLWQRAIVAVGAPLIALDRLAFGSRRKFAESLSTDDGDWQDITADVESIDELWSLLGEQRDRLLIAELDRIHQQRHGEAITVAVVYGANHVAPTVHAMRSLYGYRVRSAEWLTIFGLDD